MPTPIKTSLREDAILDNPRLNKGSAFSLDERKAFGITSRLPRGVNTLEERLDRAYSQLSSIEAPLDRNSFLWSLKEQNWVLFFALISRHLAELFPIIYTPTEAEAIAGYSHLFRRPSGGCFMAYESRDTLEDDFRSHLVDRNGKKREYDLVVISDGEAILGIGDQGAGGIGISTAKAAIYTLAAGVDPAKTLAVVLDVGTNNPKLLEDPLYLGWRHKRVAPNEYYPFVERLMKVMTEEFGRGTLIHFEDFGLTNAKRLLDLYRDTHAVFNDDIQGTGAVTLASLQAALKVTKGELIDQRIIIFGAGSAGLGIAAQIRDAMTIGEGMISRQDANKRFYLVDKEGLLTSGSNDVRRGLEEFVRSDWSSSGVTLADVVKEVKPTVMIGTSTRGGAWTESIIKEMTKHVDRPILFPLSNPTKLCEVQPKDAYEWTGGKALLATGSPFDPVTGEDGDYVIAECNNALVYPGIGFGAILAQTSKITNKMLIAATTALANLSPAIKDPRASLLPDFKDCRAVNLEIALAVLDCAIDEGVANVQIEQANRRKYAEERQWSPKYRALQYDPTA